MSSQDDFVSSQDSNMDEEQMQALEASAIPNSTSRATKHGVKKFDDWAAKRNIEIFFHAISAPELATILRKFYAEVKHWTENDTKSSWELMLDTDHHNHDAWASRQTNGYNQSKNQVKILILRKKSYLKNVFQK